ncbi:hypothetical protein [Pedobacter cryoconitis]|uniref:N-acetyltransferase domain-containing protein n=1 Tax=Pedobacter cryoconitis TaxID=188932 RepID=A0A7X0J5X3_9SPHI|nr:hypothetical protein [Pedobacter cryoconitis]MBB6501718.1 hypothetical protein [Pedobacter cryoconitis]
MGIKNISWKEELKQELLKIGIESELFISDSFLLMRFRENEQLFLHLITIDTQPGCRETLQLQQDYLAEGKQLIQLWEDVWQNRTVQVLSRISALLGRNKRIHGRKTNILSITQPQADQFLNQHHLQGSATSRYRYALLLNDQIVAVATFSGKRKMIRKHPDYTSAELIRFATADGFTVQGGLSKLLQHFIKTLQPDDVMTYADLDWSYGKGYTKLGFELVAQTPPAEIWLDTQKMIRYFPHRLPPELNLIVAELSAAERVGYLNSAHYFSVFNMGNLKYILHL